MFERVVEQYGCLKGHRMIVYMAPFIGMESEQKCHIICVGLANSELLSWYLINHQQGVHKNHGF